MEAAHMFHLYPRELQTTTTTKKKQLVAWPSPLPLSISSRFVAPTFVLFVLHDHNEGP